MAIKPMKVPMPEIPRDSLFLSTFGERVGVPMKDTNDFMKWLIGSDRKSPHITNTDSDF